MKKLARLSMVAVMLLFSAAMAFAQQKPNIHILATGGTIAGTFLEWQYGATDRLY